MRFLRGLSVRVKIVAGYILVLGLMMVIGVVALLGAGRIRATVSNLADELAVEQSLADEIVSQIWTVRLFAQRYIRQQTPADLTRFKEEMAEFNALLAQANEQITARERARLLADIQAGVKEYSGTFYQVVNLLEERNTISQGTLDVQGSLADLRLQKLRDSIFDDGGIGASYYAGNAQENYLKIRLNTFRYLDTGDEAWLSERRYQEALNAFDLLAGVLEDPAQQELADEAEAAVRAYIQGLELIQENFTQQEELVTQMSVTGPEIEVAGDAMSASVAADFQMVKENTRVLINRARGIVLIVMGFAIFGGLGLGLSISHNITQPITSLMEAVKSVTTGDLEQRAQVTTEDEVGELSRSFNKMTETIQSQTKALQESIEITQRRTRSLELSAEVSQAATSILEPNELVQQVVELIRDRFDLYYVGLFLVDETGELAVLRAGTGEAGRQMLHARHKLKVGGQSMIGQCVARGEARIALDVGDEAVHFDNPLLPETRSEGALPLRSRGQVLGAITVQSMQPAAFDEDVITVLQTMADQVAVALDNARLFAESEEALEAEHRAYGELSREAWEELLRAQGDIGILSDKRGTLPAGDLWEIQMEKAMQTEEALLSGEGSETGASVTIPIKVRDQVIGVFDGRKADGTAEWTPEELNLLETLTDQLGQALESARLYADTQRRAAREQLLGEMTARFTQSLDLDAVLQAAVQELGKIPGVVEASVHVGASQKTDANGDTEIEPGPDGLTEDRS